MNVVAPGDFAYFQKEQRSQSRIRVALPALASVGGTRISISIVNIAVQGAMIETATILEEGARLNICCGTIGAMAVVVWRRGDLQYGLRFAQRLTDREVEEQVARSIALRSRRDRRLAELAPQFLTSGAR